MRNLTSVLLTAITVTVLVSSVGAYGDEKRCSKKDVPPAVLAAFTKAYPNAKVKGYSKETEGGKVFYEVESMDGKIHRDVLYTADGTMDITEEGIPLASLPAPVQTAMARAFPSGTSTSAEKITHKDGKIEYEVVVKEKSQRTEVVLNPDGTIVKKEVKSPKDED